MERHGKFLMLGEIKKKIIEMLTLSEEKFTPLRVEKELIKTVAEKKLVRKALREMILQGEIFYTDIYGSSYIEKSINKPLYVSNRVVLIPVGMNTGCDPGWEIVRMIHGGSFGSGHHPTTRISIRGIDFALSRKTVREQDLKKGVLDIGTGSGVLAIAAVKLGMKKAIGIDIEPIARQEARENVRVNGLSGKIEIEATEINMISRRFFLILANLGTPTLKQIVPHISRMIIPCGVAVVSGFREEELLSVRKVYTNAGFHCIREESEAGWSGIALERCV